MTCCTSVILYINTEDYININNSHVIDTSSLQNSIILYSSNVIHNMSCIGLVKILNCGYCNSTTTFDQFLFTKLVYIKLAVIMCSPQRSYVFYDIFLTGN